MAQEETKNINYNTNEYESAFEVSFESSDNDKMDEEEKKRIRQELLSLEW